MRVVMFMLAIVMLATTAEAQKIGKAERAAIDASPEDVARTVKITDGELDSTIWISTEPFYQYKAGLLKVVNGDKYMRAGIDKFSNKITYQLYFWMNHYNDWLFLKKANYIGPSGLTSRELIRVASDVGGCSAYLGCLKSEHYAMTVPREDLDWLAKDAKAGTDESWKMKVFADSVEGGEMLILKTEVAGFLVAVDKVYNQSANTDDKPKPVGNYSDAVTKETSK